jgi:DNA polymerase-4/DNA polymerase V
VRRFTPDVEEYSIDECFADLTGLQRPLRMSYGKIAEKIKASLDAELGFTFSVGLAPNKVLGKVGSKWKKPSGLTVISGRLIHRFIEKLPVEKVWGIGPQTTALLNKYGINTALEFARKDEKWVKDHFTKPHYEIWQELNGKYALQLQTQEKTTYQSIQKFKTFTPASSDHDFVFSQLSKNIENACMKARKYKLGASGIIILLRTQEFRDHGIVVQFSRQTAFPNDVILSIESAFKELFSPQNKYRSTGVVLLGLEALDTSQLDMFGEVFHATKMIKLFESVDAMRRKFGKHTLFLGSSFSAQKFSQHIGERGDIPTRKKLLFKGETVRKRLAIPMFTPQGKN